MWADDIALVAEVAAKYGPLPQPVVEVGGLEDPCIADYQRTIDAMRVPRPSWPPEEIRAAQEARYLKIHRPLEASAPGYRCEDPSTGGCDIEDLPERYGSSHWGTIIALSTLEHVRDLDEAASALYRAIRPNGLLVVSVPFEFPYHPSPKDYWRFTPDALRVLFIEEAWWVLECDWRLNIPASAGVLNTQNGEPQAIRSCYLVGRAK